MWYLSNAPLQRRRNCSREMREWMRQREENWEESREETTKDTTLSIRLFGKRPPQCGTHTFNKICVGFFFSLSSSISDTKGNKNEKLCYKGVKSDKRAIERENVKCERLKSIKKRNQKFHKYKCMVRSRRYYEQYIKWKFKTHKTELMVLFECLFFYSRLLFFAAFFLHFILFCYSFHN